MSLMDRVVFAGYVPERELVDHYNLADVYILPSREIHKEGDVRGSGLPFWRPTLAGCLSLAAVQGAYPMPS
jgi:glycosyltransferase involved in cell wall biosynthesis